MKQKIICLVVLCWMFMSGVVSAGIIFGTDIQIQEGYMVFLGSGVDDSEMESLELGSNYIQVDNIHIGVSNLIDNMYFNVSYVNELGNNRSVGERLLEMNITYTGGATVFTFTGNDTNDNMLYDLKIDGVLVKDGVGPHSFSYTRYSWSEHMFTLLCGGYHPDPPYNGSSSYDIPSNTINLTWERGNYSNQEIVVGKSSGYPSSPSDGTVWQNSTNLFYNFTVNETQYFTVWSYNATTNTFSSTGLDIPWGVLGISVFNESKPWEAVDPFGLLISNQEGTDTYQDSSVSNILYLNYVDIPFGTNTIITINASGYRSRTYYYDFVANHFYNLTLYIPPLETETDPGGGDDGGSGENFSTTRPYTFRVIDEDTYPISNVRINVKRYFNTTDSWENVSILLTDGYGQATDDFIPGVQYKLFASKTGYASVVGQDWEPDPIFYGSNYPVIIQMNSKEIDIDSLGFWDIIVFNGTLFDDNSLHIVVNDFHENITNLQLYVYELYNGSQTILGVNSSTSQTNLFIYNGVNTSREFLLVLHMNHSELGYVEQQILVEPLRSPSIDIDEIEDKIEGAAGGFELGYVYTFLIYVPTIFLLVLPGRAHPGFAIVMASMYMGLVTTFLTANLFMFAPFICAVGIALIIVKKGVINL